MTNEEIYARPLDYLDRAAILNMMDQARRDERAWFKETLEKRRLGIMEDASDPSWTEHLAELQCMVDARTSGIPYNDPQPGRIEHYRKVKALKPGETL